MDEAEAREKLKPFLDNNPKSDVKENSILGKSMPVVTNPWGDASMVLGLDDDAEKTIAALNGLILPDRLSAIYHREAKRLEVLWTAYRLNKNNQEVYRRKFAFAWADKIYDCGFLDASDALLDIAGKFLPVGASEVGYRNLPSFASYVNSGEEAKKEDSPFGKPACFWIYDLEYSDDALIDMLKSLNFYMSYYDDLSPVAIIHPPQLAKTPLATTRYRFEKFPNSIASRALDPELLQFWGAAQTVEPARRFLYAYRIIEHAAFFYVDHAPKLAVRKALMVPHALDDIGDIADRVLAAVRSSKIEDWQRFEGVVTKAVDPVVLWEFIGPNIDVFSKTVAFDGGFELTPLVAGIQSRDEFLNSGLRSFCALARRIRNALAHGREDKNATVILPTKANYEKLRPWAMLITRASGEIILYEHA